MKLLSGALAGATISSAVAAPAFRGTTLVVATIVAMIVVTGGVRSVATIAMTVGTDKTAAVSPARCTVGTAPSATATTPLDAVLALTRAPLEAGVAKATTPLDAVLGAGARAGMETEVVPLGATEPKCAGLEVSVELNREEEEVLEDVGVDFATPERPPGFYSPVAPLPTLWLARLGQLDDVSAPRTPTARTATPPMLAAPGPVDEPPLLHAAIAGAGGDALFLPAQAPLLPSPGSSPPRPPTTRRKTLARGIPVRRSSQRIAIKHRGTPITKMAEKLLCRSLVMVGDGVPVTAAAIASFAKLFEGRLPSIAIAALRALFKLDCDFATAVEAALIDHGGEDGAEHNDHDEPSVAV